MKDSNCTKTPQSGSKPAYVEPVYTKTAATIPQKLRNNKGGPPTYDSNGMAAKGRKK